MSKLLEILGRGMTVDTAELIWDWLNAAVFCENQSEAAQTHQLDKVIELMLSLIHISEPTRPY